MPTVRGEISAVVPSKNKLDGRDGYRLTLTENGASEDFWVSLAVFKDGDFQVGYKVTLVTNAVGDVQGIDSPARP